MKLTSGNQDSVVDLAWNPGLEYSSMLATCSSDGSIGLWDVKDGITVLGAVPAVLKATCCKCNALINYVDCRFLTNILY